MAAGARAQPAREHRSGSGPQSGGFHAARGKDPAYATNETRRSNQPRLKSEIEAVLKTKTVAAEAKDDGIYVSFEGEKAPAEAQRYDLVLVAVGRTPNGKRIGADKAGVAVVP